ncbi:uncharacterized protein LOC116266107 [Nymphaea colorata]|nr:uncharacterized protein LOC116266107 [Nymphaea colorata]
MTRIILHRHQLPTHAFTSTAGSFVVLDQVGCSTRSSSIEAIAFNPVVPLPITEMFFLHWRKDVVAVGADKAQDHELEGGTFALYVKLCLLPNQFSIDARIKVN